MVEEPDDVTNAQILNALLSLGEKFEAFRAEIRAELKTASEERGAIRNVIDNQLAGQDQVDSHERRIKKLEIVKR